MHRTTLYVAAALSGIAAAYVLSEWVLPWWDARHPPPDDKPTSPPPQDTPTIEVEHIPEAPPEHADPNKDSHASSLPPLCTHSLPPPLPNGRALPSFATHPDAMTSSTSLHTLSTQDGDQESVSQSNTSDADTEPFVDVLSPPPAHVLSRRRSLRNHDLFAASHMSFSDLGNLIAPQDEPQ